MSTITPSSGKALSEELKAVSSPRNCPLKMKTRIVVILSKRPHRFSEQPWESWSRERAQSSRLVQSGATPEDISPHFSVYESKLKVQENNPTHYTNWLKRQKTDLARDTSAQNPAKTKASTTVWTPPVEGRYVLLVPLPHAQGKPKHSCPLPCLSFFLTFFKNRFFLL